MSPSLARRASVKILRPKIRASRAVASPRGSFSSYREERGALSREMRRSARPRGGSCLAGQGKSLALLLGGLLLGRLLRLLRTRLLLGGLLLLGHSTSSVQKVRWDLARHLFPTRESVAKRSHHETKNNSHPRKSLARSQQLCRNFLRSNVRRIPLMHGTHET